MLTKVKCPSVFYPLWCEDLNKSATNTQQWQLPYFIDMTNGYDAMKINKLYFN